jgi:hypothetical protein
VCEREVLVLIENAGDLHGNVYFFSESKTHLLYYTEKLTSPLSNIYMATNGKGKAKKKKVFPTNNQDYVEMNKLLCVCLFLLCCIKIFLQISRLKRIEFVVFV